MPGSPAAFSSCSVCAPFVWVSSASLALRNMMSSLPSTRGERDDLGLARCHLHGDHGIVVAIRFTLLRLIGLDVRLILE